MANLMIDAPQSVTRASREAAKSYTANAEALPSGQPDLLRGRLLPEGLAFLYARDGSLTARTAEGEWVSGCSVPQRLAEQLLRTLKADSPVSCFLFPSHPAQIAVALKLLRRNQAVIAILRSPADLAVALHCHDFSAEIAAHRIYFVAGPDWAGELASLLRSHPGLPSPQCFIRTSLLPDAEAEAVTAQARRVIEAESHHRSLQLKELRRGNADGPLCVLAPSHFRLWDDAGALLPELLADAPVHRLDPDDPSQSSHLMLAMAAANCRAIVTANLTRAELPPGLLEEVPMISWLTGPRIPRYEPRAPRDGLILTQEDLLSLAQSAGWPRTRLAIGVYPTPRLEPVSGGALALIFDTTDPSPQRCAFDLSTHRLLWEYILEEIGNNPFCILPDVAEYLASRARKLGIAPDMLDRQVFGNDLILPAYQQAVARLLIRGQIPLRLHGAGWKELTEFAPFAAGPVTSRPQLLAAVSEAAALLHAMPGRPHHPMEFAGRPILKAGPSLLSDARRLLAAPPPPAQAGPPFSAAPVLQLLA